MVERKLSAREELNPPHWHTDLLLCCWLFYKDQGPILPYLHKSRPDNISNSLNISSTIFNDMDNCCSPFT